LTLKYLAALYSHTGWPVEIILVDNCCTDDTAAVASETWKKLHEPFEFYIVEERTPGLSAARVRGIETARYDYLVFCDDDNFLNEDYLTVASEILEKHPQIGALGGYASAMLEWQPAYWPGDFYIYGCGPQAEKNGKTRTLHGAGIIINRAVFIKLKDAQFSFILSDRKGAKLTSGGDYEFCYAITLAGYDVWYEEALRFSHYIQANRVTPEYCKRFIHESAPALDVILVYEHLILNGKKGIGSFYFQRLKDLLYHIWKIFTSCKLRFLYRHDEQIRFLESFHIAFHLARIKLMLKNIFRYPKTFRNVQSLQQRLWSLDNKEKNSSENLANLSDS
jgi:glycosyltransferase involved in cell wall biosynthesis